MINLTIYQEFIAEVANLFEISLLYRWIVNEFKFKNIIMDLLMSTIFVSIPLGTGSNQLIYLVIYFWLNDRIVLHPNTITNSIVALLCISIIPFMFDLVDHYAFIPIKHRNIKVFGWFLLLAEFLAFVLAFLVVKQPVIKKHIQWFIVTFRHSFRLWLLMIIFFFTYIAMTTIAEYEQIANKYSLLILAVYFSMLIFGGVGFTVYIRSYQQNLRQRVQLKNYQKEMVYIQRLNKQYEAIRRERHDIKNMLLSIQGYVEAGESKQASAMLHKILQNGPLNKSYGSIDHALVKIKDSWLRNLIKEKAYQVVERGIPLSIDVNAEIDQLPGSDIINARIIGILLDNALEATAKQRQPFIQVALLKRSEGHYQLVVCNSLEQAFDINKAVSLGKTNKKGHHGIGLANLTKLVNDDDHYSFDAEVEKKRVTMTCFIQEGTD